MVEQLLNSLPFYFFSDVVKSSAKFSAIRNLLGYFSLFFWGHFGVTNGRHNKSALYRAENIRDQLLSPRTTKLWRGYRVCPVRMYVSTYVRTYVRSYVHLL